MEVGRRMRMEMEMAVRRFMEVDHHLVRMSGWCKMLKVVFGCWVMRFQGVLFIVFG
jgi:hypothetical protein